MKLGLVNILVLENIRRMVGTPIVLDIIFIDFEGKFTNQHIVVE